MLLIGDHQAEILIGNAFGNQRVRADDNIPFPRGKRLVRQSVLFFRQRAGKQAHARAQRRKQRKRILIMLLGKHFGGGHQRRLETAFPGQIHGAESHGGFAAAHVSLQKPGHGRVCAHIVRHFIECPPLRAGGRESEQLPKIFNFGIRELQPHAHARVRAQQRKRHLIEEQFLKGNAPPRRRKRFGV